MDTAEWLRVQGTEWPGIGANEADLCKGFREAADEIERLRALIEDACGVFEHYDLPEHAFHYRRAVEQDVNK